MLDIPLHTPECEPSDVLFYLLKYNQGKQHSRFKNIVSVIHSFCIYETLYTLCQLNFMLTRESREKLHSKGLHDLISSSDIIWAIKPRTWRCRGYVVCMTEKRNTYRVWWRNLMERDYLEDLGVDRKIRIKIDLKKVEGEFGMVDLADDSDK